LTLRYKFRDGIFLNLGTDLYTGRPPHITEAEIVLDSTIINLLKPVKDIASLKVYLEYLTVVLRFELLELEYGMEISKAVMSLIVTIAESWKE
jgi:hypothetical protein